MTANTHMPVRPTWRCSCGDEWPCHLAMLSMEEEFRGSRPSLSMYLISKWFDATQDLPDESPERLYQRIVAWPRR